MKKLFIPCAMSCALFPTLSYSQPKLEEVVVTASLVETPVRQIGASVSVIDSAEIELKGYSSVVDLLRSNQGVSASNTGGPGKQTSLSIRGEEGYRTLILIDGVEVSDPTGTQIGPQVQYLSSSGDIERIEILRGPQGFIYGADSGGVINIFTKSGEPGFSGGVRAEAGDFQTKNTNAFVSGGDEEINAFLSISDQQTEGFNTWSDDASGEADGYENTTAHFKLSADVGDQLKAQIVLRDVDAESDFDNCFGSNDCVSLFEQTTGRFSIGYDGVGGVHKFGFSSTSVERDSITDGTSVFFTSGEIEKVDYLGAIELLDGLKFVFGSDFKTETLDSGSSEGQERDQLGVFTEFQVNINDAFYLTQGLRYDDNEDFGEHSSVRMTSAYIQDLPGDSSLKYRASLGSGFRSPSLSELAYNRGPFAYGDAVSVELKEEDSQGVDVGLEYFYRDDTYVGVTLFRQRVKNEIVFDNIGFSGYLQNVGKNTSRGVEVEFEYAPVEFLKVKGGVTLNKTNSSSNEPRSRKPEKMANLSLQFAALSDRLNMLASTRLSRDSVTDVFGSSGQIELDNYQVFDVSGKFDVTENLNMFVRVENVFDESYEEVPGYNTSGLSAYAGFNYRM